MDGRSTRHADMGSLSERPTDELETRHVADFPPVTAIVIRNNGRLVSMLVLAAIVGWLKGMHGYDAELVEMPEEKAA